MSTKLSSRRRQVPWPCQVQRCSPDATLCGGRPGDAVLISLPVNSLSLISKPLTGFGLDQVTWFNFIPQNVVCGTVLQEDMAVSQSTA